MIGLKCSLRESLSPSKLRWMSYYDENMEHFLNSIHCLFIKSLPTYEWSPEWQLGWPPRWGVEACAGRGLPTFSSKSSGVGGTSSTPASLKTPPNALVTHLMTMTTLILGLNLNLKFVILHPFQIWELQNMPFILFVDLAFKGKIDENEYVVNYLQGNSNWKLRWFWPTWTNLDLLEPTWTNGRWRSLIFSRLHLKPKQVKECLEVEFENQRNLKSKSRMSCCS